MITSKQRAYLRGLAQKIETILTVGKAGIIPTLVRQCSDALTKRELIKGQVLENAPLTAREAADQLAAETQCEVVQVIGRRFALYRPNPEKPQIVLPK